MLDAFDGIWQGHDKDYSRASYAPTVSVLDGAVGATGRRSGYGEFAISGFLACVGRCATLLPLGLFYLQYRHLRSLGVRRLHGHLRLSGHSVFDDTRGEVESSAKGEGCQGGIER